MCEPRWMKQCSSIPIFPHSHARKWIPRCQGGGTELKLSPTSLQTHSTFPSVAIQQYWLKFCYQISTSQPAMLAKFTKLCPGKENSTASSIPFLPGSFLHSLPALTALCAELTSEFPRLNTRSDVAWRGWSCSHLQCTLEVTTEVLPWAPRALG